MTNEFTDYAQVPTLSRISSPTISDHISFIMLAASPSAIVLENTTSINSVTTFFAIFYGILHYDMG